MSKNNKDQTVKAAKGEIQRDKGKPTPQRTQGTLTDRYTRQHTPERLYGEDSQS
ncbi:hypothetical protein [Streptomyces armeniacus]|uniref:hypothetical protein n=1 Tax=Streptomyces armeniacus TaxID=83291 RepID=UPI001AD8110A|nr:hypothetical protein [Streptomyces armeniacus]